MLKELTRRYRFINYVHLLIETAHEPLSRFMQRLLTRYVHHLNPVRARMVSMPEVKKVQDYIGDEAFMKKVLNMLEKERRKKRMEVKITPELVNRFFREKYGRD